VQQRQTHTRPKFQIFKPHVFENLVILSHAAAVNSFSIETDNELIMYRNIFK
jgi:hypothetical protein